MKDFIEFCFFMIGVFVASIMIVVLVFVFIAVPFEARACANQGELMGVHHQYGMFEGCMFEVNGVFVPRNILRVDDLEVGL